MSASPNHLTGPVLPAAIATPYPTLDPVTVWDDLPADLQRQIGASAIATAIGKLGSAIAVEHGRISTAGRYEAVGSEALSLLYELVVINVLVGDDVTLPPRPNLRPRGLRQCRVCGCTDDFACEGGCSWVEADLCSRCTEVPGA